MIQRIQSVYLLLTALLVGLLFFFKLADFPENYDLYLWKLTNGERNIYTLPLLIIAGLSIFISVGTIFFYKKRTRQIKLCLINFVLLLVFMILLFWIYPDFIFSGMFKNASKEDTVDFSYALLLPIIAIIGIFMANRAIIKDEKLLKSADRLR